MLSGTFKPFATCQPARPMTMARARQVRSFWQLLEIDLHHLRRQLRQHQCESVIGAGLGGSEDVGECEALVSKPGWTLALGKPDVTDAAFLPDPRFVLKEQS